MHSNKAYSWCDLFHIITQYKLLCGSSTNYAWWYRVSYSQPALLLTFLYSFLLYIYISFLFQSHTRVIQTSNNITTQPFVFDINLTKQSHQNKFNSNNDIWSMPNIYSIYEDRSIWLHLKKRKIHPLPPINRLSKLIEIWNSFVCATNVCLPVLCCCVCVCVIYLSIPRKS